MQQKFSSSVVFPALAIVFALCLSYGISAITFMLNLPLTQWHFPLAVITGIVAAAMCIRTSVAVGLLFIVIALAVSYFIAVNTVDISWDGMWYHQSAVIAAVEEGVNFYHTKFPESETGFYINHYPMGAWLIEASIFKFTGNIEAAKLLHPLWMFAAAYLAFYFLRSIKGFSFLVSLFASVLIAFNPVALNQYNTFYIDGQIASQLTCLFLLSAIYYYNPLNSFLAAIGSLIVLLANMKFTTVAYSAIFVVLFSGVLFFALKFKQLMKYAVVSVVALLLGVLFFGAQPYLQNYKEGGHIFHPLAGPKKVDIITGQYYYPRYLIGKNNLERFAMSLFSFTAITDEKYAAKGPFIYQAREFYATCGIKWLIGGMGPFYTGVLLIGLLLWLYSLRKSADKRAHWVVLFFASGTIVSVIINPENWSARYVPQLWFLPFLFAFPAFSSVGDRVVKALLMIGFVYATINCSMFIITSVIYNQNRDMKWAVYSIKETNKNYSKVVVYAHYFDRSFKKWLEREGITHWEVKSERIGEMCEPSVHILNTIHLCPQ